eukprot:1606826-Rhodomonas_salina.1
MISPGMSKIKRALKVGTSVVTVTRRAPAVPGYPAGTRVPGYPYSHLTVTVGLSQAAESEYPGTRVPVPLTGITIPGTQASSSTHPQRHA